MTLLNKWTPIARFESVHNERRVCEDWFLCFWGRYDRQRTLAIRIATITLASDSAIIIARFRPSKIWKEHALELVGIPLQNLVMNSTLLTISELSSSFWERETSVCARFCWRPSPGLLNNANPWISAPFCVAYACLWPSSRELLKNWEQKGWTLRSSTQHSAPSSNSVSPCAPPHPPPPPRIGTHRHCEYNQKNMALDDFWAHIFSKNGTFSPMLQQKWQKQTVPNIGTIFCRGCCSLFCVWVHPITKEFHTTLIKHFVKLSILFYKMLKTREMLKCKNLEGPPTKKVLKTGEMLKK